MSKKGHTQNKKSGRHTTNIETAAGLLKVLTESKLVSKFSLGQMKCLAGGKRGVKILEMSGGLKVTVRGPASLQEIMVYTTAPKAVKRLINKEFAEK